MRRERLAARVAASCCAAIAAGGTAARAQSFDTWTQYLGGTHSSQYSSLAQIDRGNVGRLELVWRYPVGGLRLRFNPIVVDGVMYALGRDNAVVALDAATGEELWVHGHEGAVSNRGINYWASDDGTDRRLLYLNAGHLTALDAEAGTTIATFGDAGRVDLRAGLNRETDGVRPLQTNNPGRIYDDLVIVALPAGAAGYVSTPGDVHAYDVVTGELEWVFHSVPEPGEFGADTWPDGMLEGAGGVHSWSELTVDDERGIVYVPFGSPRYDYYGGNRHGANLFGDSLVALDARTGERIWHYQLVHHDLWDYDLPTAPKLLTVERDGERVDAVIQATKWGYLYAFDRATGEPLWPIDETAVPESSVPGEQAWPTQPLPTAPPPFSRQHFSADDVNPYLSDEERRRLRERLLSAQDRGLYTPPSFDGSLRLAGGSSWGGAAVDPARGTLYVTSQEVPTLVTLREPQVGRTGSQAMPNVNADAVPYAATQSFLWADNGLSAIGPPWSRLTAYDMNAGTILWQVPNGHVAGLDDAGTGSQTPRGGPLVTAGGLIFMMTSSDRMLRAYDQDTGDVLWTYALEAAAEGVPATYRVGGRQYVVAPVGAGSGTFGPSVVDLPEPADGAYLAFALPLERPAVASRRAEGDAPPERLRPGDP